jgi:hypothetical protein
MPMRKRFIAWLGVAMIGAGCATSKIDWNARVGHYDFDTAVKELGVPSNHITLSDGSIAAEWILNRGGGSGVIHHSPGFFYEEYETFHTYDTFLELVFDKSGQLSSWKKMRK